MAAALEGVAPKVLAKLNKGEAPWVSLVFSSVLASGLLLLNYSRGLVGAFTFLIMMTTVACLVAYLAVRARGAQVFLAECARLGGGRRHRDALFGFRDLRRRAGVADLGPCPRSPLGVPVYYAGPPSGRRRGAAPA